MDCEPSPSALSCCRPGSSSQSLPVMHTFYSNGSPRDTEEDRRKLRNISEKKRRDQFNFLVRQLGKLIFPSYSKLEKSAVLKATISVLKTHKESTSSNHADSVGSTINSGTPSFISGEDIGQLVVDSTDLLFMTIASDGRILFMSSNASVVTGWHPDKHVSKTVFDLICRDDGTEQIRGFKAAVQNYVCYPDYDGYFFTGKLTMSSPEREVDLLAKVVIRGHFHTSRDGILFSAVLQLDCVLPCAKSFVFSSLSERLEFASTLSEDFGYYTVDGRVTACLGYSAYELLGTSLYCICHLDDIDKLAAVHEEIMRRRTGKAETLPYRLLSKGGQWIWVRSVHKVTTSHGTNHQIAGWFRTLTWKEVLETCQQQKDPARHEPAC